MVDTYAQRAVRTLSIRETSVIIKKPFTWLIEERVFSYLVIIKLIIIVSVCVVERDYDQTQGRF